MAAPSTHTQDPSAAPLSRSVGGIHDDPVFAALSAHRAVCVEIAEAEQDIASRRAVRRAVLTKIADSSDWRRTAESPSAMGLTSYLERVPPEHQKVVLDAMKLMIEGARQRTETDDAWWTDVRRRRDETLTDVLNTMPTTLVGLAAVLQYLGRTVSRDGAEFTDPEETLLVIACDADDDALREAAETWLARLSVAVAALTAAGRR